MTVEGTTMDDMNATEATRVGDSETMRSLEARLRERGWDGTTEPASTEPDRETPEEAAQRRQRRQDVVRERWDARVPEHYREARLEELDDQQNAAAVRGWLRSGALHLVLAGPVGTGKTHAAYAVGRQALEAGLWVEAWNVGDLMDQLRPGSTERVWDRARRCQVLILDDLVATATEWEAARMQLLLDARVRHNLQTVITTNITSQQMAETWGSRAMDRLSYRLTALTFTGPSRRGGAW